MSIPYVANAFRGWTKKRACRVITKSVIAHRVQLTAREKTFDIMVAPLQPEVIARKPEEQRSWKWWSILTKSSNPLLSVEDQIVVDGITYVINSVDPWNEAGFRHYEATQNYTGLDPMYGVIYSAPDATGGSVPESIWYQDGASVTVAGVGDLVRTGYTFAGWSGHETGDVLTIAGAGITLVAEWEVMTTT